MNILSKILDSVEKSAKIKERVADARKVSVKRVRHSVRDSKKVSDGAAYVGDFVDFKNGSFDIWGFFVEQVAYTLCAYMSKSDYADLIADFSPENAYRYAKKYLDDILYENTSSITDWSDVSNEEIAEIYQNSESVQELIGLARKQGHGAEINKLLNAGDFDVLNEKLLVWNLRDISRELTLNPDYVTGYRSEYEDSVADSARISRTARRRTVRDSRRRAVHTRSVRDSKLGRRSLRSRFVRDAEFPNVFYLHFIVPTNIASSRNEADALISEVVNRIDSALESPINLHGSSSYKNTFWGLRDMNPQQTITAYTVRGNTTVTSNGRISAREKILSYIESVCGRAVFLEGDGFTYHFELNGVTIKVRTR